MLTAAVIATLPAPALSSKDSSNIPGPNLVGDAGDFTNCFEMTPVRQPQVGLPRAAGKGPPVDIYVRENPMEGIAAEIARAKRGAAGQATPGSLLVDRNLPPSGAARPDQIKAACGIPGGLTLFAPAAVGRGGGA